MILQKLDSTEFQSQDTSSMTTSDEADMRGIIREARALPQVLLAVPEALKLKTQGELKHMTEGD